MKNYSVFLTFKCNWDCSYCNVDTHSKKSPPLEQVMETIDSIDPNSEVELTGGEPGFAKPELVEYAFAELEKKGCKIAVNTNGAFFERYPQYCDRVDSFYYHCSEDLDTTKEVRVQPYDNVDYVLIVTDDNIDRLDHFITTYPELTFHVIAADETIVKGKWGSSLSRKNAIKIFTKYGKRLHKESLMRLLERSDKLCFEEGRIVV